MGSLRVLAAMSGGVDSAVAAARAAEAGHEVTGVHLALSANPRSYRTGARGCCTLEDARDARRAADVIGIPFYVWDMASRFHEDVVQDFVDEYARGHTPNPCLRCNEKIKFSAVLDRALALGFDAVCTGHYARLGSGPRQAPPRRRPGQGPVLRPRRAHRGPAGPGHVPAGRHPQGRGPPRGRPARPAGRRASRTATTSASSPTATPGGSCRASSATRPARSWTRTARRSAGTTAATASPWASAAGCGIGRPAPDGQPRYVLDIEPVTRTVTVGPAESLDVTVIEADRPVWTGCPPPAAPVRCAVQLRAHGEAYPATVTPPPAGGGRRPADDHPGRPGPRRRPRPGRRALRRRPGPRLGDDQAGAPAGRRARLSGGR